MILNGLEREGGREGERERERERERREDRGIREVGKQHKFPSHRTPLSLLLHTL